MATSLEQYGTGGGIPLGGGIGGTAALIAGLDSEFAVFFGFGVAGGLVVGGFAGRFTDENLSHTNWQFRVIAYTMLVSLVAGGLLGVLAAWMVDGQYTVGVLVGGASGGIFSLIMSAILIAAGRKEQTSSPAVSTD